MPVIKKNPPAKPAAAKKETYVPSEGDYVKWMEDGNEYEGTISEIKGKNAVIDVSGELWQAAVADLTKAEAPEPDPEPEPSKPKGKPATKGAAPKKGSSLSAALNAATPAPDGGGGLPLGKWEALLVAAEIEEGDFGTRGVFTVVGVNDTEVEGKKDYVRYLLLNPDGTEGQGLQYFKRDLAKLGLEDVEFADDDELNTTMTALGDEQKWIDINVVPQKNNKAYTNVYIDGLKDEQENKPECPQF